MDAAAFAELVERYRAESEFHPTGYRLRVAGLVALGYGYVVMVFVLLLVLALGLVVLAATQHTALWLAIKIAIPIGALAFAAARSLWVTIPEPAGAELESDAAPRLASLIDEVRVQVGAPPLHRVKVTGDFNAGVASMPRFGLLGGSRHVLLLGLPLLQALTPDQLRAVLAHEFGHLSHAHGRFGAFVYGMRRTWSSLLERLGQERRWGQGVFTAFVRWYAPYFNASTFVLARAQEYEADRTSADATSPATAAGTLARIATVDAQLREDFWPAVFRDVSRDAEPPARVFARMGATLAGPVRIDAQQRWLANAQAEATGLGDTHPSLRDRLLALGFDRPPLPAAPFSPAQSAASLLGGAEPVLVEALSTDWCGAVRHDWRVRHHEVGEARAKLAEFEAQAAAGPLPSAARLQHALLCFRLDGPERARPLLETLLAEEPTLAPVIFLTGQARLAMGEESGLALLERTLELDDQAVGPACDVAIGFLLARGRREEAERWATRALERRHLLGEVQKERARLVPGEAFDPHGLPAEAAERIRARLQVDEELEAGYLVRRRVRLMPERPALLCAILPRARRLGGGTQARLRAVMETMAADDVFPPGTLFVVLVGKARAYVAALDAVPGARLR